MKAGGNVNLDCSDIKDMIDLYCGGCLSSNDTVLMFSHLTGCTECRRELKLAFELKKHLEESMIEVPDSIKLDAFKLMVKAQEAENVHQIRMNLQENPNRPLILLRMLPEPMKKVREIIHSVSIPINETKEFIVRECQKEYGGNQYEFRI
jgi:hypothetical protein